MTDYAKMIPPEVVDKFYMDGLWMGTPDEARAAIAAALNVWPGKAYRAWDDVMGTGLYAILPLKQEPGK